MSIVRGKELPFLVLAPGRRILQFSVLHDAPALIFYREVVGFLEKHGAKLLGGYTQLVEGKLEHTYFVDITEASEGFEETVRHLSGLPKVLDFKVLGICEGVAVDDTHFPLTSRRGKRMIVFSAEIFSQALGRLYELFGSGAAIIFQEMGMKHGQEMTLALKTMAEEANLTLQPNQLAELMLRYLQSCGWAIFRLKMVKEKPLDAEVEAQELFEPLALHEKSAKLGCNLFKGELAGIFSTAYRKKVKVEETSCKAKGASACIFKITE